MNIRIDLRPEKGPKKTYVNTGGVSRFFAVLLVLAFVVVSGLTLVYAGLKSHYMQAEIQSLENSITKLQVQDSRLSEELERLKDQEKLYTDALALLEAELPSLEFLASLEQALPLGVWLDSVKISKGSVSLNGKAFEENDVVVFAEGLLATPLVSQVSFPSTSRSKAGNDGTSMVTFSFSCRILDITTVPSMTISGGVHQ